MATDTTESDGRIEIAGVDEMDGDDLYEEGEILSDGDESGPLAMARVLERVAEVPRTLGISGLEVLLLRGNDLWHLWMRHSTWSLTSTTSSSPVVVGR